MKLSLVACTDMYAGIGKNGTIPWINEDGTNQYPADFKHFQKITKGKSVIMGRKTYEDIVNITKKRSKKMRNILPGRKCLVLSRNKNFQPQYAEKVESLRVALFDHSTEDELFVIGGEGLFLQSLPFVQTAHITIIDKDYHCDRFLPITYMQKKFQPIDGKRDNDLYFVTYERTVR